MSEVLLSRGLLRFVCGSFHEVVAGHWKQEGERQGGPASQNEPWPNLASVQPPPSVGNWGNFAPTNIQFTQTFFVEHFDVRIIA